MDFSATKFESRVEGGFFIPTEKQQNKNLGEAVYSRIVELPVRRDPEKDGEEDPKTPKPIHRGQDQVLLSRPTKYNCFTVREMSPEALEREWFAIWDNYEPLR